MGGNVFKNGTTRRYSEAEYAEVVIRIHPLLVKIGGRFGVIPAYEEKDDFGDMDILIVPSCLWDRKLLDTHFKSGGNVSHNGGVWSLVFEEIQVDLITTSDEGFDPAMDYFSYNDFGNLRGKIIHKFGMKFGHDGLTFPVRSADHILGNIMLSRDAVKVNELFGFKAGPFTYLEDMFESVIGSPYFNPAVFSFEAMNAAGRVRDKKRSSYNSFLKYIEKMDGEYYPFHKDKSLYLDWIFHEFPHAKPQFDRLLERKAIIEAAALKFNGDLVREWTGLDGVELGHLMKEVRPLYPPDIVIRSTESQIMEHVKRIHNANKTNS